MSIKLSSGHVRKEIGNRLSPDFGIVVGSYLASSGSVPQSRVLADSFSGSNLAK